MKVLKYLVLLLFVSCSTEQKDKIILSNSVLPVVLKDSVAKYYCTINSTTKINAEVKDNKISTQNTTEIGLLYLIKRDSIGNYALTLTFDKLRLKTETNDIITDFDASSGIRAFNPTERMLASIKGSSLYVSLNRKGEVLSVKGYDTLIQKIMALVDNNTPEVKEQMQKQLAQFAGDDFIKNNVSYGFSILPDSAVSIGDTWSQSTTQSAIMPFALNTKYTLSSAKNGIATITSMATFASDENSTISNPALGTNVKASLKGKLKGTISVNTNTGMVEKNNSDTKIEGSIFAPNGTEVPVTIRIIKEITIIAL